MPRVLIVGEAPGRTDGGLTRRRISELSGRPWEEWADWLNLIDEWPGPSRKGSAWNAAAARRRAESLDLSGYEVVVLLGRRVAGAMLPGGAGFPYFRWTERGSARAVVIPHTSGIVRWWNDAENVATARRFLTDIARQSAGRKESTMTTKPKEPKAKAPAKVTAREAVIATLRAAGRPMAPSEVSAIVIEANVVPDLAKTGTTPADYRIEAPIYREAAKGRFYKRVETKPAKFALRDDAPASEPELVATLRRRIADAAEPDEAAIDLKKAAAAADAKAKQSAEKRKAKPDPKAGAKS